MPCICEQPEMPWEKQLEMMLEQACRYLTVEQISSIHGHGGSGWIGCFEWYRQHLLYDFHTNYENEDLRKFYQDEGKRLGWNLIKIDGGVTIE